MHSSDELFQRSQEGYLGVYFPSCKNNTRVNAETIIPESTYIILFLTWHDKSTDDDKNDDLYTLSPCLTRFVDILVITS